MLRLLKQRDNWESKIGGRVEQQRIYKYRFGYAKKEAEKCIEEYKTWLKENKMEPTNPDILLIN
jgi:hypothetical protein